jgi:hypothetical protein
MLHFLRVKKSSSEILNLVSLKSSGKTVTLIAYEDKLERTVPCIKQYRDLEIRYEVLAKYIDPVIPILLPFIATIFYSYW